MRAVIQRVSEASVNVEGTTVGRIGTGWLVLLGVAAGRHAMRCRLDGRKLLNLRASRTTEAR